MKKLFVLFVALFALLPLFGQEVEPPETVLDFLSNVQAFLGSFWGVTAAVTFFSAVFIGLLKVEKKLWKYLLTAGTSIVFVLLSTFLSFGYLFGALWWIVALNFAGVLLVEIAGFSVPFIKTILEAIEQKFRKL